MKEALNINWSELSFGYMPTDYNVRCYYKNGEWGEIEITSSELIPMHIAATCLHYGQEAFEGLKPFPAKAGKGEVFGRKENANRIARPAEGILMRAPPREKSRELVKPVYPLTKAKLRPSASGTSL